jgi:cell division septal protein FtsQ
MTNAYVLFIFMRWKFHRQRESKNPLFTKPNWQQFIIERFGFFGWMVILIVLVVMYLIFYSPLLAITRVEISGTQNISPQVLKEKFINWQLHQRRFGIFTQNNILMFSRKWLGEQIARDYNLASLKVDKKFPHTLRVTLVEKKPDLVWVSGGINYFLSESGEISSVISNGEQLADLPLIYDDSNSAARAGQAVLTVDKVSFIHGLITRLKQMPSVEVTAYHMLNGQGTQFNVQTKAGYTVYFDTSKDLEAQVAKLQRILDDKAFKNKPAREYIDVRLGDRVYYK